MKIKNVFILTLFFINFLILVLNAVIIHKVIKLENQISINNQNIISELSNIETRSNKQFSETKSMKKTYDDMLAEQKKKTVDTITTDTAVAKMIEEGDMFYKTGNYFESFKVYTDVLSFDGENNDVRLKRMISLYYMNPMDTSKYPEILSECDILKHNGKSDKRLIEIERTILTELGKN